MTNMNSANTFPNSIYPPFGYNDNNFNRATMPSNIYPNHGGYPGNPNDRFNPMTQANYTNIKTSPNFSNFQNAYKQNQPMIEKIEYQNQNNLIHNNVNSRVLDETVVEYRIDIDSIDRDIGVYPSPFCFTVKFAPLASSIVRQAGYIESDNGWKKSKEFKEVKIQGTPNPSILREFKNVKFIRLEYTILPMHGKLHEVKGEFGKHYVFNDECCLANDRFLQLVIKELDNNRTFTTAENVVHDGSIRHYESAVPFGLLICDKRLPPNYYTAYPIYGNKIYDSSTLFNLTQLTLDLRDSYGAPLNYDNLYSCDDIEYSKKTGNIIDIGDLRHPLNKKIQVHYCFTIGVVQSQVNTNTKFEQ